MARFVTGYELTSAIHYVTSGNNIRCAVAHWGHNALTLFDEANGDRPRVICDVTLGRTSPLALNNLGAPRNRDLRYIPGLHARVYLSDRGALVGSADAFAEGDGHEVPSSRIEAGVLLAPDDNAFRQVASWFETVWGVAKTVGKSELCIAAKRFRPRTIPGSLQIRPGSLLDLITADPDRFCDVSIVLVKTSQNRKKRNHARAIMASEQPDKAPSIASLPDEGVFYGWSEKDISRWCTIFIEMWMPNDHLFVYWRKIAHKSFKHGIILSKNSRPSVRRIIGGKLPTREEISRTDGTMVQRLLDRQGDRLFSAPELAAEIELLSM